MNEHWGAIQVFMGKLYFVAGVCVGIYTLIKCIIKDAPAKSYFGILVLVGILWLLGGLNYFFGKKILIKNNVNYHYDL